MTTATQPVVVSDVILKEDDAQASRADLLVDESQTLSIGEVCKPGPNGRRVSMTANADEVQTVNITGTVTAGTFSLKFVDLLGNIQITDPIAEDANNAGIQAGVDTALGANIVTVGGGADDITAFTLTYDGLGYAGKKQTLAVVLPSSVLMAGVENMTTTKTTAGGGGVQAAVDHMQTSTSVGTASAGTFTITAKKFDGTSVTTAAIAWDDNAAAITTALNLVLGTDACVVTGSVDAQVMTFDGEDYAGRFQDPISIDVSSLTGVTSFGIVQTTLGHPATEGNADSICLKAVTTAGGAKSTKAPFLIRNAVVNQDQLDFGAGNESDAVEDLKAVGIITRREPLQTTQLS